MFRKSRVAQSFMLIFLVGTLILPFIPTQLAKDLSPNPFLEEYEDNKFLDYMIMFYPEIPRMTAFESLVVKKYSHFPVIRIEFNDSSTKLKFFDNYKENIYQIEPNKIVTSSLDIIQEKSQVLSTEKINILESTGARYLHQTGINGSRTKIGIIDTGVSNHNVEFGSRIKGRSSFVSQKFGYSDDITSVDDSWGHGTHVAGLAAGATTGIAPGAEIYSAKIIHLMSVTGAGGGGGEETTAGMLEAIEYLVNNSVDVINLSVGQYHNLPTGLRDEIINFVSINNKVVFSISAGNSGTSGNYGERGTLNNPATALQSIAVTATNSAQTSIANFASRGPKIDYSLKPDIAAPGSNIKGPSNSGSGYTYKSGTSMASPIVGGAAALLIDYLKSEGLSYSAATVKAALLAGARTLQEPIWEEGSGFLNITRALEILMASEKIENIPNVIHLHPQKLPIEPYEVLFSGSSVTFNLTVVSSKESETNIQVSSDFVSTPSSSYVINNSVLIPINFTIPVSSDPQFVTGYINISNQILDIEFEVRKSAACVLFDETLNRIVRHGYSTGMYSEHLGDSSSTICMYSAFTRFLAYENNYSVTPHVSGEITLNKLLAYDVFIMVNPFSLASDIYMDWVENPGTDYLSLSTEEITAISQYVNAGGGLLIISSDDDFYDLTKMNEFLSSFNFQIQLQSSGSIFQSEIDPSVNFTQEIGSFPFRGNYIQTTGAHTIVVAEVDGNPTLALYEDPNGGRVLLYGSDLIFDNIGFSSYAYNGNTENNKILAFNSVAWLAEGEFRETTTTEFPEIPYPLFLVVLILSLGIIFLIFLTKSRKD
ncbi:MAG: S8 family serine peptidase [Candidatus Heimdallarchaeota archaeon]|nr:MAG: S8 family serine peptidase [Candidatus Heimdallarchaeota archaeon]